MPYLKINTNIALDKDREKALALCASPLLSELLNKPESYIMIEVTSNLNIVFAASTEPAAYLELKSIGLPEADTKMLSSRLCDFIQSQIDITPERIYIEFCSANRHLWGWNKNTF